MARLRPVSLLFLAPVLLALVLGATSTIASADSEPARSKAREASPLRPLSAPTLVKAINLRNFGSHVVRFGRLSQDGVVSAVFIKVTRSRAIECLTAVSLKDGSILWQRGTPIRSHYKATAEVPVQVYDWSGDGIDDVILWQNGQLLVLNGLDGAVLKEVSTPQPYSLFIFQTQQFGGHPGLILHGRASTTLLDPELAVVWERPNEFSHFPMALDIDDDGENELLAGYLLFRSDGALLWDRSDLRVHNDAADFADTNCDGLGEVAIATSNRSALLSREGDILWRGVEHHAQHITVGSFIAGSCEKQIATIDRDAKDLGILRMYNNAGTLMWSSVGHGRRAIMSRVDNWIPGTSESLILVFRSFSKPPTLYDGLGRVVSIFPFRLARAPKTSEKKFNHHFVQHFDTNNDGAEELLVSNERAVWIYSNKLIDPVSAHSKPPQSLPNPRVFNSTFYMGMQ